METTRSIIFVPNRNARKFSDISCARCRLTPYIYRYARLYGIRVSYREKCGRKNIKASVV